jgi:hypothetical protein
MINENMGRKKKKRGLEKYETTLLLLSILLAIMSIIMIIPLKP